jgi:hypothetical protein
MGYQVLGIGSQATAMARCQLPAPDGFIDAETIKDMTGQENGCQTVPCTVRIDYRQVQLWRCKIPHPVYITNSAALSA